MRRLGIALLAATAALSALASGACGGNATHGAQPTPTDIPNRAGAITLTRSSVAGGLPSSSVIGIGAFFAPPGPPDSDPWPASGTCVFVSPTPTPSATPTATPAADFHDAGAVVTLTSPHTSIDLDRFASGDGTILYVTGTVDPAAVSSNDVFALSFPGGSGAHAIPPTTLAGALVMPDSLRLTAPDFSAGPVALPRSSLSVTWDSSAAAGDVEIRIAIAGTGGAGTLLCATPDTGSYQVAASSITQLPSGTGQFSVMRRLSTATDLDTSTVLVGTGRWLEGGVVSLP